MQQSCRLDAGGTLSVGGAVAVARRIRLVIELTLLFVGAPLLISYLVHAQRMSLILLLQPVLIGLVAFLLWDKSFSLKRELAQGIPARALIAIIALFALVAAALGLWVWRFQPEQFLSFPRTRLAFWAIIMVFYPLLSTFPQELIYRTFYFHRFGALFGGRRVLAIALNGALFGFAHLMFGSWVSVVLSGLLGALLAYRYTRTRTFWAVWLEHALYGDLVFTVGLGRYFFTGHALVPH
jgi:hypothetical protein